MVRDSGLLFGPPCIFSSVFTTACNLVRLGLGLDFNVRFVSCYAHVFVHFRLPLSHCRELIISIFTLCVSELYFG